MTGQQVPPGEEGLAVLQAHLHEQAHAAAIDQPDVLLALQDIRQRAAWLEQRDREQHTYTHVSVRDLCIELGYGPLVGQVLQACADGGFNYCLDHTVECYSGAVRRTILPPRTACQWGADQLRSRMDTVDWRVRTPQQLYTVDMPGAFESFWTGTGVAQGQEWDAADPVAEAGARQLRAAYERGLRRTHGRGSSVRMQLTRAAVQVLADYCTACISSIEGSSDPGMGSELRAARQLLGRCERVLA